MKRLTLSLFVSVSLLLSNAHSQIVWQKLAKNPVVPVWSGNIDDPSNYRYAYAPSVYSGPSAGIADFPYRMWFSSVAYGASTNNLSYAVSMNGTDWFFHTRNPVLSVGEAGAFDRRWVIDPCVIKVGNEFRLYYTGYNGSLWQTGLATSSDGIKWTKYPGNPILAVVPSTWESIVCAAPRVYYDGSSYKMLYTGYDGNSHNIGHATSTDGIHWTRYASNPVLRKGDPGSWDQVGIQGSSFVVHDERIFLFYCATGGPTGFAVSTNWINWTKYSANPVFQPGPSGSWDGSLSFGSVMVSNNVFQYWYAGIGGGFGWQIGYATSPLTYSAEPTNVGSRRVDSYSLSDSYPNPFNPDAIIYYTIPTDQRVSIKVYDALGQEVSTLVDEMKPTGAHTAIWNARNVASGVYWYKMVAGDFADTRKMVLTK